MSLAMILKGFTHEVKDLDESKGIVKAYANAYDNVDSDDDISAKGSFIKTASEGLKKLRVLYNHDRELKLGVPLEVNATDPYGLLTTTQFNLQKSLAKDAFTDIQLELKNGQQSDLSIGYSVVKRDQKDKRIITEYKLFEYSFLSFLGANPNAIVLDAKGLRDLTPEKIFLQMKSLTDQYNANYSDGRLKNIESELLTLQGLEPLTHSKIDEAVAVEIKEWIDTQSLKNYLQNGN